MRQIRPDRTPMRGDAQKQYQDHQKTRHPRLDSLQGTFLCLATAVRMAIRSIGITRGKNASGGPAGGQTFDPPSPKGYGATRKFDKQVLSAILVSHQELNHFKNTKCDSHFSARFSHPPG